MFCCVVGIISFSLNLCVWVTLTDNPVSKPAGRAALRPGPTAPDTGPREASQIERASSQDLGRGEGDLWLIQTPTLIAKVIQLIYPHEAQFVLKAMPSDVIHNCST